MTDHSCPLCGNQNTVFFSQGKDYLLKTTDQTFYLYHCAPSDILFLSPMPSEKEIPSYYPSGYWWSEKPPTRSFGTSLRKQLESIYRRWVLQGHVRFVMRSVDSMRKGGEGTIELLDVGCSGGTFLFELSRPPLSVKGIDFSAEAIQHARTVYHLDCAVGDLEHSPWKNEKFSILTCFHVLEHIPDPRSFLKSVRRALKPAGRLILQVPNTRSWQFAIFGVRWYGMDTPRHLIHYNERSLARLLEEEGFRVLRRKRFSLRDDAAAWVSSTFPGLDPLARAVRSKGIAGTSAASSLLGILQDFVYFFLWLLALPLAGLDSFSGRGATIMVEAGLGAQTKE